MRFTVDVPISGASVMLKLVAASLVVAPPMIANAAMAETMARSRAKPQYAFIFPPHPFYPRPPADVPHHEISQRGWLHKPAPARLGRAQPRPGGALTSRAVDRSRQSS